MSIIATAKAKSRELSPGLIAGVRRVVLVQMILTSALIGLDIWAQMALKGTTADIAAGLAMGIAMAVVMLWQLARIAALTAPGKPDVHPLRMKEVWLGALIMRLVPQLAVAFITLVLHEQGLGMSKAVLVLLFGGGSPILSMLLIVLVVLLLALCMMTLYVTAMQWVIRAADRGPLSAREMLSLLRNGVRYVLSPAALFFSYIGWYALMVAVFVAVLFALGCIPTQLDTTSLFMSVSRIGANGWITSVAKLIAGTWLVGAGIYFWPRFFLTQAVYQRQLIEKGESLK